VQLRWLIENNFDFQLNSYPIFDESYRAVLNQKILDHYKFKEIGFETPALFRHYLKTTLNEIMPYYNQLYKSQLLQFNPLYDVDYQDTYTKNNTINNSSESDITTNGTGNSHVQDNASSSSTSTSNDATTSKNLKTDTGQGAIGITDIDSVQFATEVDFGKSNDTNTNNSSGTATNESTTSNTLNNTSKNVTTGTITNVDDYTRHVIGNKGSKNYSQLLTDFRSTFLNIDMEIINNPEVQQLFFGLW
jgi:hypothetical protein